MLFKEKKGDEERSGNTTLNCACSEYKGLVLKSQEFDVTHRILNIHYGYCSNFVRGLMVNNSLSAISGIAVTVISTDTNARSCEGYVESFTGAAPISSQLHEHCYSLFRIRCISFITRCMTVTTHSDKNGPPLF
ncbi:hypothetical protein AVEN_166870-1 [Araneus ventricosus]|uniref:Uncharacterized protein n=1 Tax=Araneus ventricosus TaxID=182803 RepID=A0A4Y2H7X9_ARAVE|nr:hypothetical protein AVEN_166870-1 [Araneus ventricosus]